MRHAVFAALSSLLLLASGCKSQCRILAEKVCDCSLTSSERNNCLAVYAQRESQVGPLTAEQEEVCEGYMETCDCRLLDTQAGKERCGVAYGPDAGM